MVEDQIIEVEASGLCEPVCVTNLPQCRQDKEASPAPGALIKTGRKPN